MPKDRRSTRAAAAWSAVAVTTTLLAVALIDAPNPSAATGNLVSTAMQPRLSYAPSTAPRALVNPGSISNSNSGRH
ncbi:hypothetical protein JM946_20995 [Steroidobacter sp. S1-65]|uniref:Uncharacterized protein n=1 Tax=Steroidobacter gossypii TaxID=2805490 RepID=A0ABS1X1W0_9GAMM|nr:hypothetical protein [Steroidobacter gossypii]MBM0107221.1 hypothetical protein [Steroidobacter gossypii]